MTTDPTLQQLRQAIDSIDNQLLTLLKQRIGVVEQVGEHKRGSGAQGTHCFLRPKREAEMIRDLWQRDVGSFPKPELAKIWRQLIGGSLIVEQPMTVGFCTRDHAWLMREYFGSSMNFVAYEHLDGLLRAVKSKDCHVGVIPMPSGWSDKMAEKLPMPIFAQLPFWPDNFAQSCLLVGDVLQEPTSQDLTWVYSPTIWPDDTPRRRWLHGHGEIVTLPTWLEANDLPTHCTLLGHSAEPIS